ncbi:hypothetical protein [Sphingomonas trueperi]|uniref:hypothetical protein n=1 Tax=Sphingomonas trueperi TaxID=53317 RepID=UPI000F0EF959
MSSAYPAKRIPQYMILIGGGFVLLALVMAVEHFVFGVPLYNRNTGQPLSDIAIVIFLAAGGAIGTLLALIGRAALRAASAQPHENADANGS